MSVPYLGPDPVGPNNRHLFDILFLLVYRTQCIVVASLVELQTHDTLAFVIIMLLCWVDPADAVHIVKQYLRLDP